MSINLEDYNDVASRLAEFREKHPQGSLQAAEPFRVVTVGDKSFVCYTAAAYRSPEDPRPGIGVAWEPVPGRTPYTRDSELQNAETSAWGRAIVAALAADTKKGIASREELQAREAVPEPTQKQTRKKAATKASQQKAPVGVNPDTGEVLPISDGQKNDINKLVEESGYDLDAVLAKKEKHLGDLSFVEAERLIEFLLKQKASA